MRVFIDAGQRDKCFTAPADSRLLPRMTAGAWRARSVRAAELADQGSGPRQPSLTFFFAHDAAADVCHDLVHPGPFVTRPACPGLLAARCPLGLLRQFFLPLFRPFRLEVISPGGLHSSMTVEKMIAGRRYTRNNILVGIMRSHEYVDHRGMGIRSKALLLLKAHKHPESVFEATEDYSKTTLYRKRN